ncbi:hypothetical protein PTTG_00277 [Puccinia triticina 1-1 BBBD Race 1]|uniref:Uncharacterized protein n=2 Tax=Puccinia triticina TaxID=208348 RepID=A0A180GZD8_PUCT1|nr:uncharacterized protein PtA15_8A340 [Puccinia triticina]OAV98207.1 hypothetical protein PTTG_00277 [Puccinia triticina 1-1 BBBD Race 1]WAQ87436.1 hypothetical protein PtA15_8A340 [Puccinia triticina]WAR57289.1 hypothetical protein PtB15_8B336 [Puccinia triticina]
MPASFSVARATATLPRHWSKPLPNGQALNSDPRISKKQQAANKTRLILQNYLKSGIEPPPEVLDSLDPTNLSYDGTLSSKGSTDSLKVTSAASDERKRLVRKQTRRQSILPSFFEPINRNSKSSTSSSGAPVALTTAALTQHDYPAVAFLAPSSRVIRRATSFAGTIPPPPMIRIVKPEPECLDDHSNPSSRDPFYYDKVLDGLEEDRPSSPRRQRRRINSKVEPRPDSGFDQGGVTAWFADQYLAAN